MKRFIFLGLVLSMALKSYAQVKGDSTGYSLVDGKVFVHHKVGEKETLFSIAQRYSTTMYEVIQENPGADAGLRFGQMLKVPYGKPFKAPTAAVAVANNAPASRTHKVQASETIFSISRRYEISVADIKRWNNLQTDAIKVGQILVVASPPSERSAESTIVASTANTPEISPRTDRAPVIENARTPVSTGSKNQRVKEKGIAEVITGTDDSAKFLALHKTAPVGTIVQVTNPMNNVSIFVRVVGKLPETGDNEKLIIKLSKSAYERLNALDKRFLVELSYIE